jgi:endonuclease/exonuclease/phosphatase family metal-dependent hydrolase
LKILSASKRLLMFLFLTLLTAGAAANAQPSHLVISQVYGGGGGVTATTTYTYKTDYIELYNPTSSPISLSGLSLQYASAAGNFASSAGNLKAFAGGVVQPGHYFLVTASGGSVGGTLPVTADDTSTLTISATAGKVALVNSATSISALGSATSCTDSVVIDEVSFGSSTSCAETTAASAPSNTTAVLRTDPATDTNNNSADFAAGTPCPRTSTVSTCPVPSVGLTIGSATANPANVLPNGITVFTVVVAPGTSTTGIAVTADLSQIGGSATQALTPTTTANTYTYTYTVPAGTAAATYSLPVSVTSSDPAATGSISLGVVAPTTNIPIETIQGNRSTYVGTTITTTGVVTLVQSVGFYIQTPSATPGSGGVSQGIYIFSGTGKVPVSAVVGNNVTVTGNLALFPAATDSHTPSLEVTSAAMAVNSTGNTLPTPIAIASGVPTATGGIYQFTKYESMRVTFPSLTAVGPTDAFNDETNETTTSTGQFYVVATGTPRPFREPGMDFRDFPATTCPTKDNCTATVTSGGAARPANLVLYDDNPERLIVESSLGGGTALNVSPGAVITNVTGVLDFSYATDVPYGDPARLILEPGTVSSTSPNYTPSALAITPLPLPSASQFTVAAFNVERFFNTDATDNKYYDPVGKAVHNISSQNLVVVTPAAYARRLQKFSLAVRTVLNNPDIIAVEEAENISVLRDMAAQIDADTTTGAKPGYVPYGTDATTTFTNDIGGISIGFLVKPGTTSVTAWEQKGKDDVYTASNATSPVGLNDRPSQVLHATVNRGAGNKPYPITVIVNHLRSLNNINNQTQTREKKELQAEMLATLIQGYQTAGEHVIAVGDMNAFQFSDGYTDTMGTITGNLSPTGTSVLPGKSIVAPAAVDLITTLPADQQQTYTEWGSYQVLDHAVVTADIAASTALKVAHIDADFPVVLFNDATTPAAISDHDALLSYLNLPAPIATATLTGTATFPSTTVGLPSNGQAFTLTNTGETAITFTSAVATGDFTASNNCPTSIAVGASCAINVVFKPTTAGARTGTLTVTSSTTVAPVNLTGTGIVAVPDFTLTDSGSGISVAVIAGSTASLPLKLTSTNGFAGPVTLACAYVGATLPGANCTVTSPVTLTVGGTATATVTITTTSRTATSGLGGLPMHGRAAYLLLMTMMAAALMLMRRAGRSARVGGLLVLLFALAVGITGCSDSGPKSTTNPNGTPAGSYGYAVTATANGVSHTQTITLTVQ